MMTVRELIEELKKYPSDAIVHVYDISTDDVNMLDDVTKSDDAPEEEVYLEISSS